MEQQFNTSGQTAEVGVSQKIKSKTPLLVKIIAWLMLLGGIGQLLMVLPVLIISLIFGIIWLLIAAGLIITSFGLHGMKKWALYMFTIITVLALGISTYSFLTSPAKDAIEFFTAGIQALVLVYLWVIFKKFA